MSFRSLASNHQNLSLLKVIQPPAPFPYDHLANDTLRYVRYVVVSALSSRVVTVSSTSNTAQVASIRLWDTSLGSVFWQKDVKASVSEATPPQFSEDGRCLAAYDGTSLEFVDAHSGHSTQIVGVKKFGPKAFAISNSGSCLALVISGKGDDRAALFEQDTINENGRIIHFVSTCGFHDNQICYSNGGRSLILAGHLKTCGASRLSVICWDVESRAPLHHFTYGQRYDTRLAGPVYPIIVNGTGAVLMRIAELIPPKGTSTDDVFIDEWDLDPVYTFMTISHEGRGIGSVKTQPQGVVHGVDGHQVIFLKDKRYLWTWDVSQGNRLQLSGRIHHGDAPPIAPIGALARFGDFGERLTVIGNGSHFFQFFGVKDVRSKTEGGKSLAKRRKTTAGRQQTEKLNHYAMNVHS